MSLRAIFLLFFCIAGAVTFSKVESVQIRAPTITLSNGYEIPAVGLGTYKATANDCERAVKDAIDAGYRHIDSAYVYENEKDVGNGVRAKIDEGVIKREDIFITTKLWNTFHDPTLVPRAFQKSLDNLNLTYIDLYLLHWPMAFSTSSNKDGSNTPPQDIDDVDWGAVFENGTFVSSDIDYLDTWRAMEELMASGKVRSLGISNFNSQQIDRLLAVAKIKPVVNQVECHPNFNQRKLLKFCADRNITVTAYSPLGQPSQSSSAGKLAINDPKIAEIAAAHNKLPNHVVLRYTYQNGAVVIPKSTNEERIRSNIDIFDFELSKEEMEAIDRLDTNNRVVAFEESANNKYYPFGIEF